jgi:iron complex outermembrane recepter protein
VSSFRVTLKMGLLAGSATIFATTAFAQQASAPTTPAQPAATPAATPAPAEAAARAATDAPLAEIVVTGSTSGRRTLLTSSSDVTVANAADIVRKAPRSTADVLELVPGVFVEGTAGPVSNNYSVRGLQGGAQTFITLEEDGLPVIYGGGGADEYFQSDISIDKVEAVVGGTSGILAVNGAGATINFISKRPNFDKPEAMVRFTGASYGDMRADGYFSAPITDSLSFNVGGYIDSNPGVRHSPFTYDTYHVKSMLEKRFDDGGSIRFTIKSGNEHDPYYADMPYQVEANGSIGGVPGFDPLRDNIAGRGFANIPLPDSCATGHCVRNFSLADGIHTTSTQYRIDVDKPITDHVKGFFHARYLDAKVDFNGIFPGSGTGNSGLASAVDYLNSPTSPIADLLKQGTAAFGTNQFGIRNLATGQVIAGSDTAALNALNGNGLLEQTVLNHQTVTTKDFGSDFGAKWDASHGIFENSLTVGGMVYNVRKYNDQSGVATLINDVKNNSNIYDVVALNPQGNVIGSLTNNGLVSYGNWGQGIYKDDITSVSGYFNDELKIGNNLHLDFGARYENEHDSLDIGGTDTVNQPVPAGTPGLAQNVGSTFDGTFSHQSGDFHHWATTVGLNYTLTHNFALYARFATGFQTNGGDTGGLHKPTSLELYEGGVRYQSRYGSASVTVFRTIFNNQFYSFIDPINPAVQGNFLANVGVTGVQYDATIKPTSYFSIAAQGVYQKPKLSNVSINGAAVPAYDGNTPQRTPELLFTVTPTFKLPRGLGELYFRYKYVGKIYADSGDGLALPHYGVMSVGGSFNVTQRVNLAVSVDNLTNVIGITEGNPRQGQTQSVVNGYFYGRGIVGRNALASLTFKL